jgi:hypothetical protein
MWIHRIAYVRLVAACSLYLSMGCASNEDDVKFSEADMRSVVAGSWSGPIHGTSETVVVKLAQRGTGMDASAAAAAVGGSRRLTCGYRQFGSRGLTCVTLTEMNIEGEISSSEHTVASSKLQGTFRNDGDDLLWGEVRLDSDDGNVLSASFSEGHFENWTYAGYTLDLVKQ